MRTAPVSFVLQTISAKYHCSVYCFKILSMVILFITFSTVTLMCLYTVSNIKLYWYQFCCISDFSAKGNPAFSIPCPLGTTSNATPLRTEKADPQS